MAIIKSLYDLQELDQAKKECSSNLSSIHKQIGNRDAIDAHKANMDEKNEQLNGLGAEQETLELEHQSTTQKSVDVEKKLYGGSVKNPRELEDLDNEMRILKRDKETQNAQLLDLMLAVEEIKEEIGKLEATLEINETEWIVVQKDLRVKKKDIEKNLEEIESKRGQLSSNLDQQAIKLYDNLMISKGGLAVSRVEQGLCRACNMTLPTHQLQKARIGRDTVLCNTCGRILYVV